MADLDLNQEEALRRKHQQVNFVDAAVIGDEFKVGPCPVSARLPRLKQYGIANFANDGGSISRVNWEKADGSIARELGLGVPLLTR